MFRACVTALLGLLVLSMPEVARGGGPVYAPLPPPPPPPADLTGKPVEPHAKALPPAAPPATTTSSATTSSATMPVESAPPHETPLRSSLDDERLSVAPLLGFGTNNLELGVGVRGGTVAFVPHLWVGGTFVFHKGTSRSGTAGGVSYSGSSSAVYFGPEVGYDFALGPVLLRPYGGLGPALLSVSASAGNVSASDTATTLILWTGAVVLYGIPGSRFFVGADARMITVPGGPALALYALGGMTF